ncbi:MAG TPA: hypothetical protein GX503_03625 [Clostridiales bacterium]|nr:hypothetical protein [Clostridiales bacterium]
MKKLVAILLTGIIIGTLLTGVSQLPEFGQPDSPANNEVFQRYIEKGQEETGALNIVTGIILDYRAFDTFGEATVLFTSVVVVLMVLNRNQSVGK